MKCCACSGFCRELGGSQSGVYLILDWLSAPLPPLSPSERWERALAASQSEVGTPEERLSAVMHAARSTGRGRGRPRDETSQLAIRALALHLATGLSWREIAMRLKGCTHEKPKPPRQKPRKRNPNLSCQECGEAMRNAAFRLRRFLKKLGFEDDVPLGNSFDEAARLEFRRLWNV
jgi:hypothetical protein